MEHNFFNNLASFFGEVIFETFGNVKISLFTNEQADMVKLVAYNTVGLKIDSLCADEQNDHIIFEQAYDLSNLSGMGNLAWQVKLQELQNDIMHNLNIPVCQ